VDEIVRSGGGGSGWGWGNGTIWTLARKTEDRTCTTEERIKEV